MNKSYFCTRTLTSLMVILMAQLVFSEVKDFNALKTKAENGDAKAQCDLAEMYGSGEGIPKDFTEATKWIRKAAEQGYPQGQFGLAMMYASGTGLAKDFKEAAMWARKAAEQDHPLAQCFLGVIYKDGMGVLQDYVEAYKWLNLSSAQGTANAIEARKKLVVVMTPEQIAEGQRQSTAFLSRKEVKDREPQVSTAETTRAKAERGDVEAQCLIGAMYHEGVGVQKNAVEAAKWLRKAAEQGNALAQTALGWMYHEGDGVNKDYAEAIKWTLKAAEQGNPNAQNNLGLMYENGEGVKRNFDEAVKWYSKADKQGHARAQENLQTSQQPVYTPQQQQPVYNNTPSTTDRILGGILGGMNAMAQQQQQNLNAAEQRTAESRARLERANDRLINNFKTPAPQQNGKAESNTVTCSIDNSEMYFTGQASTSVGKLLWLYKCKAHGHTAWVVK